MGKSFRLPNSFGSVYKLSGNRRRPYAIAKTFGWDDQGKQIKKIIGYAETKKEGLERLFEFNKNPLTNIDLLNLTCKEAFENWIEFTSKNDEISKSNLSSYNSVFINHCKEIYKIPILKIKTLDFQHCIDSCQKGYTTRKYIKLIASKLYYYCSVQLDMPILKNFSDGLKIGNKEISDKHQPFTFEEINLLWKNIEVPYVDSILITIYTGLRPTELLKIEKEKIFLNESFMIGGIKTKAGIDRKIPISNKIKPIIEKLYNQNKKYLIEKNGLQVNYRYYLDVYKEIMKKLNMVHFPHDGRHTLATELDNINANDICTKLILGHEIDDITKGVYTHKNLQQLIETINQIRY